MEPGRAVVCGSEAVRALVSGPVASRLLGLHFVAGECSALVGSAALRQLLGVHEFSPAQVLGLVRRVCEVGGCLWCCWRCLECHEPAGSGGNSAAE